MVSGEIDPLARHERGRGAIQSLGLNRMYVVPSRNGLFSW